MAGFAIRNSEAQPRGTSVFVAADNFHLSGGKVTGFRWCLLYKRSSSCDLYMTFERNRTGVSLNVGSSDSNIELLRRGGGIAISEGVRSAKVTVRNNRIDNNANYEILVSYTEMDEFLGSPLIRRSDDQSSLQRLH